MDDSAIACDETIAADVEAKSSDKETKTNFDEKKQPVKYKISILCLHFYYLL